MQAHTVERVESWDSRPFSDGFRELHDLADREFSGAVVADGTWLFMLNGRIIGVFEGDVDEYGDADGSVFEAPDPSLALLFSMQERGGETQAKYYTNDTQLSEASETLSDANFTGYIELSENVLSGDYYVVYYGGRSMSAAFVGASEDLLTGDKAFERADDEVGLYEVIKTPVNVTEIPEVEAEDADSGAGTAADASVAGGDAATGSAGDADEQTAPEASDHTGDDESPVEEAEPTSTADAESNSRRTRRTDAAAEESSGDTTTAEADGEATSADSERASEPDTDRTKSTTSSRQATGTDASAHGASGDGDETPATGKARTGEPDRMIDEEEEWRNAKSVPTLDPDKSESTDGGGTRSTSSQSTSKRRSTPTEESTAKQSSGPKRADAGGKTRSTVDKLKRAVKQRDAKLEEAGERIENLEAERDDTQERVASLESERADLRNQVSELEAELEAALEATEEEATPSEPTAETDLSPAAALSDTNLFVRYDSKGKATLDGLGPETDPSAVNTNLRIDHHTQFEAADATIDGEDFESFLEASASYRFVSWAVRELPYEIRDSGHTNGLSDLYEAIPAVDRAELDGTVSVDAEDGPVTRTFDVVLRDRMGDPLLVADLNAEREPVTGHEMEDLVDAATTVREGAGELSAAMYLTASFFEPAALETAAEETGGGGLLSRSDKESFVNVGRKSGYHLCLVEDRNDAFHLTVPEL